MLIQPSTDSLPYIDPQPTPSALSAATDLIRHASAPTSNPHPSLPPLPPSHLTPLLETSLAHLSTPSAPSPNAPNPSSTKTSLFSTSPTSPRCGIDMSRYSSLPSLPSPSNTPENRSERLAVLRQAYTQSTYLRHRLSSLSLLETYGKNANLIANEQLESMLRRVEKELVEVREETEDTNRARKGVQEGRRGEIEGLEGAWREGVGRGLEVWAKVGEMEGELLGE